MHARHLRCCLSLLSAVWIAILARPAHACQCASDAPAYSAAAARRSAKSIVEATVVEHGPTSDGSGSRRLVLDVQRSYRGSVRAGRIEVRNGNDCAPARADVGRRYLVYFGHDPPASLTICSRIVPAEGAKKEAAAIRSPRDDRGEGPRRLTTRLAAPSGASVRTAR